MRVHSCPECPRAYHVNEYMSVRAYITKTGRRCPAACHLLILRMSNSETVLCWIRRNEKLPDVCCTCGMYTDNRVKIGLQHTVEKAGPTAGTALTHLFLHLFLGPVGWLIAAITSGSGGEGEKRLVKKKENVRISQCRLCNGSLSPEVEESRFGAKEFRVRVHAEFARRLLEERNTKAPESSLPWQ